MVEVSDKMIVSSWPDESIRSFDEKWTLISTFFSHLLALNDNTVHEDLNEHVSSARFSLLDGEGMPAGRAGNISVQLIVVVIKKWGDDSKAICLVGLLPDGKVSITEVLSIRSGMDMKDILPRWSNSVSTSDIGGDFESKSSSRFSESVSSVWSDSAAVNVCLAVFELFAWIGCIAFWCYICLRRVNEVFDSEEAGWIEPAVSGIDVNRARECIRVMKLVRAKFISVLEDAKLKKASFKSDLLDGDVGPGVVLAADKVFNLVELSVSLERRVDLEHAVSSLPDCEVSVSKVISVATLGHVHDTLPTMIV
jgi:hypothetical protein